MEAITALVRTDDNLSPISSGNYPSYSAILARTLCSQCGTGGAGNFSVSLSGQQEGQQFVLERGIGNEVCVILLFFSFSYYLEYW